MAKKGREISVYKHRELLGSETWLTFSNLRIERSGKVRAVPSISIYGGLKPVDAVLVVGDNFRAAAEAAVFLHNFYQRFGVYPNLICTPAFCSSPHINYGYRIEFWLKLILHSLGVPKDVVNKYNPSFEAGVINGLAEVFTPKECLKKVAVFSSRGYSLNVAQELFFYFPKINWSFYENPFIAEEDRIFEAEIVGPNGFAIDLMLANVVKAFEGWGEKRCHLPKDARPYALDAKFIYKVVVKGYVLGVNKNHNFEGFGLQEGDVFQLLCDRLQDFPWFSKDTCAYVRAQVRKLIVQYKDQLGL